MDNKKQFFFWSQTGIVAILFKNKQTKDNYAGKNTKQLYSM